uniref:Uncharacterized protein n=1 Tax=Chromera velia CCMP2878 TaxID=1169474 RepID=A0A0G4G609_9ALVE|eukprot:Cvel_20338.t1-p1 / transcript=Cvel_20338.t1 / gene=Cvel_20338 / organism=Chromera_velia_CCMP2878 / gene_product=hypothetical protein / transcript_product=hypothetical protein / location=Cvel_scaffold1817:15693-20506(-) / protein_length=210 / sequence_SO=supercontig / SO=protein_coding / is_pseudo=false
MVFERKGNGRKLNAKTTTLNVKVKSANRRQPRAPEGLQVAEGQAQRTRLDSALLKTSWSDSSIELVSVAEDEEGGELAEIPFLQAERPLLFSSFTEIPVEANGACGVMSFICGRDITMTEEIGGGGELRLSREGHMKFLQDYFIKRKVVRDPDLYLWYSKKAEGKYTLAFGRGEADPDLQGDVHEGHESYVPFTEPCKRARQLGCHYEVF